MIKSKENIQSKDSSEDRYLITTSLLNSWAYIFNAEDEEKSQKALNEFINSLNKIPIATNFFMQRGIDFEDECVEGKVPGISEVIKDGVFQAVAMKDVKIHGTNVLMYGRLDCLKAGKIYDIKRVSKYETQKYYNSYQHHFYMELIPEALEFHYLINDGDKTYWESYTRDEKKDIISVIASFYKWLKDNNLWETYKLKWKSKYSSKEEK
jgi:hypothetical protein